MIAGRQNRRVEDGAMLIDLVIGRSRIEQRVDSRRRASFSRTWARFRRLWL